MLGQTYNAVKQAGLLCGEKHPSVAGEENDLSDGAGAVFLAEIVKSIGKTLVVKLGKGVVHDEGEVFGGQYAGYGKTQSEIYLVDRAGAHAEAASDVASALFGDGGDKAFGNDAGAVFSGGKLVKYLSGAEIYHRAEILLHRFKRVIESRLSLAYRAVFKIILLDLFGKELYLLVDAVEILRAGGLHGELGLLLYKLGL